MAQTKQWVPPPVRRGPHPSPPPLVASFPSISSVHGARRWRPWRRRSRTMLQPRLHRFPQLLLVLPPPRPAAVCLQSATASSRVLRSPLAVSSVPRARAPGPPWLAAAAAREERWGLAAGDEDGGEADLGEALARTRELVECAMFAAVAGLAYFLSNSLAIEVALLCSPSFLPSALPAVSLCLSS